MADTKFFEDIRGVIEQLEGNADYPEFVECIVDNTKDSDMKSVEINGSYVVIYHGVTLKSIDDLKRYFTVQPKIDIGHYDKIKNIMNTVDYQTEFVEKVNSLCGQDSVRLYENVLVIENDHLVSRSDVIDKFTGPASLEPIKRLCNSFEMSQDERSIVCDGIAVIALTKNDLLNLGDHGIPIEGYIGSGSEVTWTKIEKDTFNRRAVGNINLLYTIDNPRNFTFFKQVTGEEEGLISKPYPVGKYDSGEYCYWFKKV